MAFELPTDPIFWATVALASATGVLALITYFYLKETKLIRQDTEKMHKARQLPIFALEPSEFLASQGQPPSEFTRLNLVNHGQPATDILASCAWLDSEHSGGSSREFYIVSLAKDGYAGLDIPVSDIVSKRLFVKVDIKCKDATGNAYHTTITNGLDKTRNKNIRIAYQNNYWLTLHDAIDRISRSLGDIERKLE